MDTTSTLAPASSNESIVKSEKLSEEDDDDEDILPPIDVYSYTRFQGQPSSELFKIEVRNLPRYASHTLFKKMLQNKLSLKPNKIKMIKDGPGNVNTICYVTFNCEEDRNQALDALANYIWKKCKLSATIAAPKADPLVAKRLLDAEDPSDGLKRSRISIHSLGREIINPEELVRKLNQQVAPLHSLAYSSQLVKKYESICQLMVDFQKGVGKLFDVKMQASEERDSLLAWYISAKKTFDRKLCPVESVVPSPLIDGYRNKCEFSIGHDCTVGFRLGSYKDGSLQVAPIESCPLVPSAMVKVVQSVEEYLKSESKLKPFDQFSHKGNYKQVTVRTNSAGESLAILQADCSGLSAENISKELLQLKNYFATNAGDLNLISLYFENVTSGRGKEVNKLQLVAGEASLTENITVCERKLEFKISPDAFFQINSLAAGICYGKIAAFASLTPKTLLLDVCCGTGTIGLSLAHQVAKVIGIELNANAVKDAERNAQINGITNAVFISGKAEDVINKVCNSLNAPINTTTSTSTSTTASTATTKSETTTETTEVTDTTEKTTTSDESSVGEFDSIVAIIDPPRAGLNQCVMKVLRCVEKISTVIYVSCEPRFALHNFIDLIRPVSKAYRGTPFVPVKAVPVDLFPHTSKCELILVFQRLQVTSSK